MYALPIVQGFPESSLKPFSYRKKVIKSKLASLSPGTPFPAPLSIQRGLCLETPPSGPRWELLNGARPGWSWEAYSKLGNSAGKNTGVGSYSPGDLPWPRYQTRVSCITGRFFTIWATRGALKGTEALRRLLTLQLLGSLRTVAFDPSLPTTHIPTDDQTCSPDWCRRQFSIQAVLLPLSHPPKNAHAGLLSHFSRVWLCVTPWTAALQAPLSMGFSRQEHCSGLPCPHPGDLPDPVIEPQSLLAPALATRFFTTSPTWEAQVEMHS